MTKKRHAFRVTAALSVFGASPMAGAWSLHYLVTDRALEHASVADASEAVEVEPIEAFLSAEAPKLKTLFDDYYAWLEARGGKRFMRMHFEASRPTRQEFLRAARMSPETRLPMVKRVLPGAAPGGPLVPVSSVSPPVEKLGPFRYEFESAPSGKIAIRSVLSTFADEPDWEMDQGLWGIAYYGFGEIPYGSREDSTSKAPFHMLFAHENLVVKLAAPEITEGMPLERAELDFRLARLAFETGHPYWGARFAAWASHYVQDLAQPYHSKAVPHAGFVFYLRLAISGAEEKARIKKESTQLVKNRHYAYEDFVGNALERSFTERENATYAAVAGALAEGEAFLDAGASPAEAPALVVSKVSEFAAGHAAELDRAIVAAFGPKMTEDPSYDIDSDSGYSIDKVLPGMTGEIRSHILAETAKDFAMTGRATRTLYRMARYGSADPASVARR